MRVLDTDIFTLLLNGHPRVSVRFQAAEDVVVSVVTRMEVLQGRFASILKAADSHQLLRACRWLESVEQDLQKFTILTVSVDAAREFDRLRDDRRLKKIGRADLLIASIALASRATLVTRNTRNFQQVPGLHFENWAD